MSGCAGFSCTYARNGDRLYPLPSLRSLSAMPKRLCQSSASQLVSHATPSGKGARSIEDVLKSFNNQVNSKASRKESSRNSNSVRRKPDIPARPLYQVQHPAEQSHPLPSTSSLLQEAEPLSSEQGESHIRYISSFLFSSTLLLLLVGQCGSCACGTNRNPLRACLQSWPLRERDGLQFGSF